MSSIDQLILQGIRSFGPDNRDRATIKFATPLTLILGQNGCGKTTIIEALKYVTCGELPAGTDDGIGFLHDPKLCDCIKVSWFPTFLKSFSFEVSCDYFFQLRGHVELKFNDAKGQEIVISRTAQVTQRAEKLEFKSLGTTITKKLGVSCT